MSGGNGAEVVPILVITTGGTIDKVYFDAKSEFEIGEPTVEHIFREVGVTVPFRLLALMRKDSLELTAEDRQQVRAAVENAQESQILITHGTDSMAETAETLQGVVGKTVVLTGAMAPARFRVTDAVFNVGCAMAAVQCLPEGVYLAMNGRIFEAGKVKKNREAGCFEKLKS